ncbi:hypothetical protein FRX31_021398 [Thalictrum thalictroides]|uniref:RING-type E3 ubiquitin transferase n=1 Tax=Thalictrum thalictroides TaxID=46969 RepID=A0A7J6VV91_THATH|nr:hypothetical protein FRX31_021398 [Thalictrum thalictroides]
MEGVLLQTTQTCQLDVFSRLSSTLSRTVQRIPFVLVENDKSSSSHSVVVNMDGYRSYMVNLTKVYKHVQPSITKFLGIKFSGVTKVEEEMLLLGKEMTAIGNVSVPKDGIVEVRVCKDFVYFLSEGTHHGAELDLLWIRFVCKLWQRIHGSILFGLLVLILMRNKRHFEACLQRLYSLLRRRRQQGND